MGRVGPCLSSPENVKYFPLPCDRRPLLNMPQLDYHLLYRPYPFIILQAAETA